ncbi:MAG: LytTR family DNA-binding domain-containing protein [Bacteroidota bacterium]
MKILIIEDEINAFLYLQTIIKKVKPEVEILAHLESVEDAVNWLSQNKSPDLIFLDIELSDGLSFEIFEHVKIESPIIFTTAYDQYAVEAFKLNSIGYLLKPIHTDDLKKALEKYERFRPKNNEEFKQQLKAVFGKISPPKKQRCLVKKGNHFEFISSSDIAFVNSDDGLTFLFTFNGHRHLYANTVEGLMNSLDPQVFFQINRGQIVNINSIKKIHPYFNQRMKLELSVSDKDIEFLVSRSKLPLFRAWVDS